MQPQRGSTLPEALLALALAASGLLAVHWTRAAAARIRTSAEHEARVQQRAAELLARVRALPFGRPGDPEPTRAQLDRLFAGDGAPGGVTLHQLAAAAQGWSFRAACGDLEGEYLVRIGRDLDRDGAESGPREGRDDLLGIEIRWQGGPVLASARAADPAATRRDAERGR